jgi:HAD superfamily hydrolase (TIGR01450 family)
VQVSIPERQMPLPLSSLRHFLLDMDGTLYLSDEAIAGAAGLVQGLKRTSRSYLYLTNNPTRSPTAYAEKLVQLGFPARPEDILTSGEATIRYLLAQTPHRAIFAVAPPSYEAELRAAGFTLTEEDPKAVVISFDTTLTYEKLDVASQLLRKGLPYFATNPDRVCPTSTGSMPDCGAIAAFLEATTGRRPLFIGKPSGEMAAMGLAKLGVTDVSACAMVGDRLYTDMEMAHRAGITSILVLSGEAKQADLAALERPPDYVFPSVLELAEALGL